MADVVFVAVIVAFFGSAGLLVAACDRIIGPDEEAATRRPPRRTGRGRIAA